jgi:hypothetical protein
MSTIADSIPTIATFDHLILFLFFFTGITSFKAGFLFG